MFSSVFQQYRPPTPNESATKAWSVKIACVSSLYGTGTFSSALVLANDSTTACEGSPLPVLGVVVIPSSDGPGLFTRVSICSARPPRQTSDSDQSPDSPIAMPNVRPSGTLLDAKALTDTSCGLNDSTIALLTISPLSTSSWSICTNGQYV